MAHTIQLAPMLGLTDRIFINCLYTEIGGFDEFFLPYMLASDKSLIKENILRKRMSGYFADKNVIIPQLLSNEATGLVHFANLLFDLGFETVNLNVGCPQTFVTNRGRGAGLLNNTENLKRLLDESIPRLKPQLSIKTRLGFYSPDESLHIIEILNQYPLKEIIIHARTAVQQYDGYPSTDKFLDILPLIKAPVVYNGNIISKTDLNNLTDAGDQIKGIMIGRGAFINPFIGWQIKGIELQEAEMKNRFYNFYYRLFNEYRNVTKSEQGLMNHFKEFWQLFALAYGQSDEIINHLQQTRSLQTFCDETDSIIKNISRKEF